MIHRYLIISRIYPLVKALSGSGSGPAAGKSVNHIICSIYNINKYTLTKQTGTRRNDVVREFSNDPAEENGVSAGVGVMNRRTLCQLTAAILTSD